MQPASTVADRHFATDRPLQAWQHVRMRHFVKEWREHLGMTQEQVADQIGLAHKASIQKIEKNPEKDMPKRRVERFASIFGIKPDDIFRSPNNLDKNLPTPSHDRGAGDTSPDSRGEAMVQQLNDWLTEAADVPVELIPAARNLLRTLKKAAVGEIRRSNPPTRAKER
jgi:DNA-binding XRE family transcriptional regulator